MSQPRVDRASLEIAATPDRLYAAFADAAQLMRWLPPDTMTGRALEHDLREGGRYRFELRYADDQPGKTAERTDVSVGRFLSVEPGRRIVQTVVFDSSDPAFHGEMTMTWTFTPTPGGTLVTVTAEDVPVGVSAEDHDQGLCSSLANLSRFVG